MKFDLFEKKNIGTILGEFAKELFSEMLKKEMTLEELSYIYSDKLDQFIMQEEDKKNKYVGGEFKIYYINEKSFGVSFELYFQGSNKEWIKRDAKSQPMDIIVLNKEAVSILEKEKAVCFEVNAPDL